MNCPSTAEDVAPGVSSPGAILAGGRRRPTWFWRSSFPAIIVLLCLIVIVPCVWQPRVHSLDLASHTYNAWLTSVIQRTPVSGIVASSTARTNILFDLLLGVIGKKTGFAAAETIAVVIAVLVFFWGTFSLIARINGRLAWASIPLLLMLTYGLIFRLGFFNFYLATGLCTAAASMWKAFAWKRIAFIVILVLASVSAHPMPAIYAASAGIYVLIVERLKPRLRIAVLFAAAVLVIALSRTLVARFPTSWSLDWLFTLSTLISFSGFDQLWIYGDRYVLLAFTAFAFALAGVLSRFRVVAADSQSIIHLLALNALLMAVFPSAIQFPGHPASLSFIPERISLFSAILVCGLTAKLPSKHWANAGLGMISILFFALTISDDMALTRFNADVQQAVDRVPDGSRVIASLIDPGARLNPLPHLVDRACLGRCWSYGNYEPASGHFRLKAVKQNTIVTASVAAVGQIEAGSYTIQEADAPVYALCNCSESTDQICAVRLEAGQRMCSVRANVTGR
jgi:hypothetical protein